MSDLLYSKNHEWIRVEGNVAVVGISNYAQEQLGDIIFVELPDIGSGWGSGEQAAIVESVKAASEIYAPLSGEIVEINDALEGTPELVNAEAESGGWFFKMKMRDSSEIEELMDAEAYARFIEEQG